MPKAKNIILRVTDNMQRLMQKNAMQKDITVSEYIRQLVIADSDAEDVKKMLME